MDCPLSWFHDLKDRYQGLIEEFGTVAIATYFAIFFATLFGFYVAINLGVEVQGATAGAGKLVSAYVATKLTQPLRIGATLVLTPPVAAVLRRVRPRNGDRSPEAPREGGAS